MQTSRLTSRRGAILSTLVFLTFPKSALSGGAGETRGVNRPSSNSSSQANQSGQNVELSTRDLTSLSRRGIDRMIALYDDTNSRLSAERFSDGFLRQILFTMRWNRRRLQRLIRDMDRLTNRNDRLARLHREYNETLALKVNLEDSIDRLSKIDNPSSGQQTALQEERAREEHARLYLGLITDWIKKLEEGTY